MSVHPPSVLDYGGTMDAKPLEIHVLTEFAKCLRESGEPCESIDSDEGVRLGLIRKIDGASVDGVLRMSSGEVAVELIGYAPPGDRRESMKRDLKLRKDVIGPKVAQWQSDTRIEFRIYYPQRPRTAAPFGTALAVPHPRFWSAIADEIASALLLAKPMDIDGRQWIRFVESDIAARWGFRDGTLFLDESAFPTCAAHLDGLQLHRLYDFMLPRVESNLSGGQIGLDRDWLKEHVQRKAAISLEKSRERANGLPLWLIVHSDGMPTNRRIPRMLLPKAWDLCREVLSQNPHGFARVYWADQTGLTDAASVNRVA
jgi:hypothetical protein